MTISRTGTIDVRDGVSYHYLGLSMAAIVDYVEPDIQLDRSAQSDGARTFESNADTEGEYPGFDRFGRVRKQLWVDGAFTTSVTLGSAFDVNGRVNHCSSESVEPAISRHCSPIGIGLCAMFRRGTGAVCVRRCIDVSSAGAEAGLVHRPPWQISGCQRAGCY